MSSSAKVAVATAALSLSLVAAAPAGAAPSAARAASSAPTIASCMKAATRRPVALHTAVVKPGKHDKVSLSGKIQKLPAGCLALGTRAMTSYGLQSVRGTQSRITRKHEFAGRRAHGATTLHMALLGTDSFHCRKKTVTAFDRRFIASTLVVSWTSKKGARSATESYLSVDTTQACTPGK